LQLLETGSNFAFDHLFDALLKAYVICRDCRDSRNSRNSIILACHQ
jgi:hypothetical protein